MLRTYLDPNVLIVSIKDSVHFLFVFLYVSVIPLFVDAGSPAILAFLGVRDV